MRLAVDKQAEYSGELVGRLKNVIGKDLAAELVTADQSNVAGIEAQRARVKALKEVLAGIDSPEAKDLLSLADTLVRKSVWIIGGDGWAYDIGYGGLDHVLATGQNIKVLVIDTEVYSNTGDQASKATGLGAVAKFAAGGKPTPKKDLGLLAMSYEYVFVAQIALGANDNHTIKALIEAESYDGPSIVIAYSHCIAHGIDMAKGLEQQDLATKSGYWPLYRFDPRRKKEGKNPFQLDSRKPTIALSDYIYNENRYRILRKSDPDAAERFLKQGQELINERWAKYEAMASGTGTYGKADPAARMPGSRARRSPPPGGMKPFAAGLPVGKKLPGGRLPPKQK